MSHQQLNMPLDSVHAGIEQYIRQAGANKLLSFVVIVLHVKLNKNKTKKATMKADPASSKISSSIP